MELLLEFLFEILLQLVAEVVFDFLFDRAVVERPLLRTVLLFFLGAIAGGLSLLVFPNHMIVHRALRYAAVLLVPIVIGCLMAKIGDRREKRGKGARSMEYFSSGWAFAFAFGAVRVLWAD